MNAKKSTLARPIRAQTAAPMAKPLSSPLTVATAGAATGRGAVEWAVGPVATREAGAPETGGAGGLGAVLEAGAAAGAAEAALLGGGGAPAGSVGNLMVGAEVGLGGKLMRTVSFLG